MTRHTITGVAPKAGDGSVDLHVEDRQPFHTSAEWLSAQSKEPEVGDVIVEDRNSIKLEANASNEGTIEEPDDQKKTDGSVELSPGSKDLTKLPRYTAMPFNIWAGKITAIKGDVVTLEDSAHITVPALKESYTASVGDYWVSYDGVTGGVIRGEDFAGMFVSAQ